MNWNSSIGHNSVLGKFSVAAPSIAIGGYVSTGHSIFISSNFTILPKVRIENSVVIGAGAVVTSDVPDNQVVVGNPARLMTK